MSPLFFLSSFYDSRIANSRVRHSNLSFWREMSGFRELSWREMSYLTQARSVRYEHVQINSKGDRNVNETCYQNLCRSTCACRRLRHCQLYLGFSPRLGYGPFL